MDYQALVNDVFSLFFNALIADVFAKLYSPEEAEKQLDGIFKNVMLKFAPLLEDLAKQNMSDYLTIKKTLDYIFKMNKDLIMTRCKMNTEDDKSSEEV